MSEPAVTVSLSVDEAILLSFIAHRWEVRKRFELTNVSEYFAISSLGGKLFEIEAVVSRIWKDLPFTEENWDEAAKEAAERVATHLRGFDWPEEWFERYPPSAAQVMMGTDELTVHLLRGAAACEVGKAIADVFAAVAQRRAEATGESYEVLLAEMLRGAQSVLGRSGNSTSDDA
jgi:hypothetical protein